MTASRGPSRAWYLLALGLLLLALVVVVLGVVRLVSNIASCEITSVPPASQVTIDERPVAVWSTAAPGGERCTATDETGSSSTRGLMGSTTLTFGNTTWHKVTIIEGPPGSTHTLSCTGQGTVGISDDPKVWSGAREIILAVAIAGTLVVAAFVIALVVFLKRRRSTAGPTP